MKPTQEDDQSRDSLATPEEAREDERSLKAGGLMIFTAPTPSNLKA
jgi:hypothetical protein